MNDSRTDGAAVDGEATADVRVSERPLQTHIYAVGMPFNGDTIKSKALGGSETAAYYLARELSQRGHDVTVWTSEKEGQGVYEGVKYFWVGDHTPATPLGDHFEHYARNTPHDILIMQRGAGAFLKPFASKVNIWQLHDLALHRYTTPMMSGMYQVDAVTAVSEFHKKQIQEVWNLNPERVHVVRNGVNRNLYGQRWDDDVVTSAGLPTLIEQIRDWQDDDYRVALYQSRPERGLEHLVRPGGIMDRCRELPLKLLIGGYSNTVAQMAEFYEQLEMQAKLLPNVQYIPPLSKPDLALLQQQCDLMLYPTEFEEVSCITAMEAMCAGLPMLSSECGALPETCKGAGALLLPLKDGKADEDAFVDQLQQWFGDQNDFMSSYAGFNGGQHLIKTQLEKAPEVGWENAGADLDALCRRLLTEKVTVPRALRHALEHSDIDFARWLLEKPTRDDDPIVESVRSEIERLYAFTADDHKYATHYRKHQTAYYDDFEDQVIGEDVTHSTRFRGVRGYLAEALNTINQARGGGQTDLRVLDYGCAHGHYTIPLAKTFPMCQFTGVDISERAIRAARKWAQRDSVPNVAFHETGDSYKGEGYDVIIAAEVLEHVRDPDRFLEDARSLLRPGGCLIVTTPNGRWEWQGTEAFRTGREHLRHYERDDILDLCGPNKRDLSHAPSGADKGGRPMGSWVWMVWPEQPFGTIDYERKLARYAPRETVSACLIVKDGEKTIRKCVESFIDFVDEVLIYIDPATKDRTAEVCAHLEKDFPNRPFSIRVAKKSAVVDGFDEARNESISQASGDWILWCDADEEVRRPNLLHLFLRPSIHNGYGFAQVHYSADPDEVLTSDFPCRLFRNRQGVKFYGVVHEHPEHEMGKAVTWSLVRPEIKFLHAGYVDEATRRARHIRNFPLVLRDRKKNPTRELNKFLMLRDIAQQLVFEHQQTGGVLLPGHKERAQEGIKLMEEILEKGNSIRMIADLMQYYSHCVATIGGGFTASFTCQTKNDTAPDLAASYNVSGRFHSREFFNKVVTTFSKESTKLYEDRYL